jgi:hypothetical protein
MSRRSWVRFTPRSGTVSGRCLTPLRRTGVKRIKGFGGAGGEKTLSAHDKGG